MPKNFRGQNYSTIRKNCLKSGQLFEDQEFPANTKSLFYSKVDAGIEWSRPKELCKVPKLFVEGASCDDLNPGELGNHWFVTACASLAQEKRIWQKVFPDHKEQEWDDKNQYVGMFKFHLWRFGQWIEVVVDDRLPTRGGKLVFCHSNTRNEFWSALLEKAYAKLFGDYESISQGFAVDAIVDFTGGVAERLELARFDLQHEGTLRRLFEKLAEASEYSALIVTEIKVSDEERKTDGKDGLVKGQGYTMTSAKIIEVKKSLQGAVGSSRLELVRLYNPWEAKEWTGPWSDGSEEWKSLAQSEWEKMGVNFRQEGEFWMSFNDFIANFTHVDVCHFVNTRFFTTKKSWSEAVFQGEWTVSGRNGGGNYESATFLSNPQLIEKRRNESLSSRKDIFIFKFLYNPQFMFEIKDPEDRIMVSLEQHDVKGREALLGKMSVIGFHIMKVEENRKFRVHIPGEKVMTSDYDDLRSVFGTAKLSKGRYVIVPTTKDAGDVGQFLLRLYTSSGASAKELTLEEPKSSCPCLPGYVSVTTIRVEKCEGLALPPDAKGTLDPMVILKCEGEKVQSTFVENSTSPEFNIAATFYRKKLEKPIIIEVWNHNRVMNDYVAEARCTEEASEDGEKKELVLYGRKKENEETVMPGKMHIFIRSSKDLTLL